MKLRSEKPFWESMSSAVFIRIFVICNMTHVRRCTFCLSHVTAEHVHTLEGWQDDNCGAQELQVYGCKTSHAFSSVKDGSGPCLVTVSLQTVVRKRHMRWIQHLQHIVVSMFYH